MRIIGLTGGIASGKTTVQKMLLGLGATVLDADDLYHELIAPTPDGRAAPLAVAIAKRFAGVLRPDGALDRRALGRRVFADSQERAALEAIAHPAVRRAAQEHFASLARAGVTLVIYDVPLLFETGLDATPDGVIVVWVPPEIQLARLLRRDQITRQEAEQRLASQLPLADKRQHATWVIDSSGSLEATQTQVEALWRELSASDGHGPNGTSGPSLWSIGIT